jgi:hypothetical protein
MSALTGASTTLLGADIQGMALGRTLLRIHGDNDAQSHTASTGCIIEPLNVRNRIAESKDTCLQVVP